MDALFLEACRGVVEGKIEAVEEYLAAGGDPARQLTETDVEILARPSAFDPGFTFGSFSSAISSRASESSAIVGSNYSCRN